MPPQANARLLTVRAQASTDDWFPGSPGAQSFDGGLPCYYDEKVDRRSDAGGSNVTTWRMLTLDDTYPVDVDIGYELTWRTSDGVSMTGTVQAMERNQLPGIPASMRTTELVMEVQ